ncbi:acetate--CoA ligase [Porticoccus sp.]|jgi:acetyl-CoA synthetase|nr:acetate--CoA ligase [Porticoccus sp.]
MSDMKIYPVHKNFKKQANLKLKAYKSMYLESIENSDIFWSEQAKEFLNWQKPWNQVSSYDFSTGQASWFSEGKLNASVNCIDRHLPTKANQAAIIWEGDNPEDSEIISYRKLSDHVNKLSNALRSRNVKKGDRVCIYMPMIPEVLYAMLACARIGAIHSVVFGGFSPEALKDRIIDSDCHVVVTADEGVRGGKRIPLKANADIAMSQCPLVHTCFVISHTKGKVDWVDKRDIWYHEAIKKETTYCLPENMDAEDPLFILYTSGSTGKPKGVLHTTAGYLLQAAMTHKYVFDHKDNDIYWCTADVGWVTGHSYIVYGPLCNGATTLMFEGVPTYPDASRFWQIIDKHKVSIFYTAPTAIRSLLAAGNDYVKRTSRKSLRLLGTVGEPINPEAWEWYYYVIGNSSCPIVDTWWQTETGAHMLTPLPGVHNMKPGCATAPFFGIEPALVNNAGNLIDGPGEGNLVIKSSWPSQIRGVYGDMSRFRNTYFSVFPGYYFTGDGARRDKDGHYWITGRVDDVLNISGHRIGTAEIESALVLHADVAEAAVVGCPHDIKGQGIYAYVTLMSNAKLTDALFSSLNDICKKEIGSFAKPDYVQLATGLPKTRSGKIMRRILRKIAANELDSLGDISTLADPSVIDDLINDRLNK